MHYVYTIINFYFFMFKIPKAFFEPLILLSCIFWFIQLDSLKTIDCFVAYAVLLMYSALVANSYGKIFIMI